VARRGGRVDGAGAKVARGEELAFTRHEAGVYAYLAVPGGWSAPLILGSASVSERSGLGRALAQGDVLLCHHDPARPGRRPAGDAPSAAIYPRNIQVRSWRGPQWTEFSPAARAAFFGIRWTVSSQLDRMGVRLTGGDVPTVPATMRSEPVLAGSVQITGGGQPVVTMRDGPTVGGYPKIAWLDDEACCRVAQVPPGGTVEFLLPDE
jgi:allophanate hydrolase subunit 2